MTYSVADRTSTRMAVRILQEVPYSAARTTFLRSVYYLAASPANRTYLQLH